MVSSVAMSTRHTVRTDDGTRLAAWVDGPADPTATVVLAHGWTLDHTTWERVSEALTRADPGVRVVRYDQRGHGASDHGRGRPTIRRLGDDLAAVVRDLAPQGRVVLAGHSMGGMSVLAMVGRHPQLVTERVAGVGLVSTSASLAGEDAGHFASAAGAPPRLRRVAARVLPWVMRLLGALPRWVRVRGQRLEGSRALLFGHAADEADVASTHAVITANPVATIGRYFLALSRHHEVDALPLLAEVPTSILVGSRDRLTPKRFSDAIAEALPHADYEVCEDAGHMLPLERVATVTSHLLALSRHEPVDPDPVRSAAVGSGEGR